MAPIRPSWSRPTRRVTQRLLRPVLARVDNTAPLQVPIVAQGGDAWRSSNAFGATWSNPAEGDAAPIDACHLPDLPRRRGLPDAADQHQQHIRARHRCRFPLLGSGRSRMWRRDQAGNAEERNASNPVTLRYDPEAPKLAIAPVNTMDPTLRRRARHRSALGCGTGPDRDLAGGNAATGRASATKLEGERLEARVDDAALPPGRYLLRASAADRAGNTRRHRQARGWLGRGGRSPAPAGGEPQRRLCPEQDDPPGRAPQGQAAGRPEKGLRAAPEGPRARTAGRFR